MPQSGTVSDFVGDLAGFFTGLDRFLPDPAGNAGFPRKTTGNQDQGRHS